MHHQYWSKHWGQMDGECTQAVHSAYYCQCVSLLILIMGCGPWLAVTRVMVHGTVQRQGHTNADTPHNIYTGDTKQMIPHDIILSIV